MKKNTKLLDEMVKKLRKMNGMKVKWGFDADAEYSDPRGFEKISDVAQLVENGHNNGGMFPNTVTPPRPFFKTATEDQENHREMRALIKKLQRDVLRGKISPEDKMEQLGELACKQLRESILNFGGQLEQSTLDVREYRGVSSDDPLIESGEMLDAVTFEVYEV